MRRFFLIFLFVFLLASCDSGKKDTNADSDGENDQDSVENTDYEDFSDIDDFPDKSPDEITDNKPDEIKADEDTAETSDETPDESSDSLPDEVSDEISDEGSDEMPDEISDEGVDESPDEVADETPDEDSDSDQIVITIGSYNLLNFYDTECDRGVDEYGACTDFFLFTTEEFNSKLAQVSAAIRTVNSDIQIVVEIEDSTTGDAILNELSDIYDESYIAVRNPGTSSTGILTKGHITQVINHGDVELIREGGGITYFAREFAEIHITLDGHHIIVFPAHFKSQANDDPERRLLEAQKAAEIIHNVAVAYPDALIVLGGDLNDNPGSDPLAALEASSLVRTGADISPESEQCTHNWGCWDGSCSKLDHIYVSTEAGGGTYLSGSAQVVKDGICEYDACETHPYCLGGSDHSAIKADFLMKVIDDTKPAFSTIYEIKQSIEDDTEVRFEGIVTAVDGNSFFVQTGPDEYDVTLQEKYSAVFVYINNGITPVFSIPEMGDAVEVIGTKTTYYGLVEINSVTDVTITGTDSVPAPVSVTPANVQSFEYDGVLVDVGTVTVTAGFNSYKEFTVTDSLIVDDDIYRLEPEPQIGENYHIKGVMKYSYSAHRILPRSASDIQKQ